VSVYRLKIDEITIDDGGVYTCQGFNHYGRQSTNGSVIVKQGDLAPNYTTAWLRQKRIICSVYLLLLHYSKVCANKVQFRLAFRYRERNDFTSIKVIKRYWFILTETE